MVIEKLFPKKWVEKKLRYSFLIAVVYSAICIIGSVLLFGKNSGLISVFLTSLLILPLLENLLVKEEKKEEQEKKFSFKHLFLDNRETVITYLFLFLGIFFTYAFAVFVFKWMGLNIVDSFKGQLFLDFGKGGATFIFKNFWTIFINNWWVLLTVFLIAFFIKDGAIFFIAWNASSWGVILSYNAITSALVVGGSSLKFFLIVLALSFPFLLLEALAYILAAISGNIISKDVVRKTKYIKKVVVYAVGGILVYFGVNYLLGLLGFGKIVSILVQIGLVLLILFLVSKTIKEKKLKEVFIYNYWLFVVAIVVFVLGAILEMLIVQNVDILTKIYATSMLFKLPI